MVEVEAPSDAVVRALSEAREEPRDGTWRFGMGDLVSGQEMDVVLHVNFPLGKPGEAVGARISVRDREGAVVGGEAISWQYADHTENDRQPRNRAVDRQVARLYASRARREALQLNQVGRFAEATSLIERVRRRIESYAGDDPELLGIVEELRTDFADYGALLPVFERKNRYYVASNFLRNRDVLGKAWREKTPRQ
jgi:hypothetical protein